MQVISEANRWTGKHVYLTCRIPQIFAAQSSIFTTMNAVPTDAFSIYCVVLTYVPFLLSNFILYELKRN